MTKRWPYQTSLKVKQTLKSVRTVFWEFTVQSLGVLAVLSAIHDDVNTVHYQQTALKWTIQNIIYTSDNSFKTEIVYTKCILLVHYLDSILRCLWEAKLKWTETVM